MDSPVHLAARSLTASLAQVANGISTESAALERDVENLQQQISTLQSKLNVTLERFDVVQQDCLSVETEIVDEVRDADNIRSGHPYALLCLLSISTIVSPTRDPSGLSCGRRQVALLNATTMMHVLVLCRSELVWGF